MKEIFVYVIKRKSLEEKTNSFFEISSKISNYCVGFSVIDAKSGGYWSSGVMIVDVPIREEQLIFMSKHSRPTILKFIGPIKVEKGHHITGRDFGHIFGRVETEKRINELSNCLGSIRDELKLRGLMS